MVTAQQPAKGICLNAEYENAASFTISCECQDPRCSVVSWIEATPDDEVEQVSVTFYVDSTSPWWDRSFNRFRVAWQVLWNGFYKTEHTIVLGKQAATNLASTMLQYVDKYQQKNQTEKKQ